jgi:transposase
MTLITEIGLDLSKFKTAKQFTPYLRLAPNNRVSGGKIISSRTPKGANKFTLSLRNAANSIDRIKVGNLTSFFKRVAYKKGRAVAIKATARKLAVIIWNMAVKKQAYKPIQNEIYEGLVKQKRIAAVKRMMKNSNISFEELGVT